MIQGSYDLVPFEFNAGVEEEVLLSATEQKDIASGSPDPPQRASAIQFPQFHGYC